MFLSRLTIFNDQAESVQTWNIWKSSYGNVIDLLIQWIWPDFAKHDIGIRASNTNNPINGLYRLWQRLHEWFGAPKMLEAFLTSKLSNIDE